LFTEPFPSGRHRKHFYSTVARRMRYNALNGLSTSDTLTKYVTILFHKYRQMVVKIDPKESIN
jgi:hypothetical protein